MSVEESATKEIKNALNDNLEELQTHINQYKKAMDNMNKAMEWHLRNFVKQKNRFFNLNETKTICFWIGQAANIITLGLLVYTFFLMR